MTRRPIVAGTLLLLALLRSASADGGAASFGSRLEPAAGFAAPLIVGDFDGDGAADRVYVVHILPRSPERTIAADVRPANPWASREAPEPLDAAADGLALVIVHGNGRGRFLLYGAFLNSPIWQQRPLPLKLAKKGTAAFRHFAREAPAIRHDLLVLGTEAGIDVALYWNGARYAVFWPREEP